MTKAEDAEAETKIHGEELKALAEAKRVLKEATGGAEEIAPCRVARLVVCFRPSRQNKALISISRLVLKYINTNVNRVRLHVHRCASIELLHLKYLVNF